MDESEAGSVSDFARQPFASFSEAPAYTQCRYDLPSGDRREFSRGGPPTHAARLRSPTRLPSLPPHRPDRLDPLRLVRKSVLNWLAGESACPTTWDRRFRLSTQQSQ